MNTWINWHGGREWRKFCVVRGNTEQFRRRCTTLSLDSASCCHICCRTHADTHPSLCHTTTTHTHPSLCHNNNDNTQTTPRFFHHSGSRPSVDAHFQSLHRSSATHCHLTSNHPRLCPPSVNILKNILFSSVFSQHSSVTLLRLCGLRNSCAILAN